MRMRWLVLTGIMVALGCTPALAQSAEATVWAEAQGDCTMLRGYLQKFPKGRFVARGRAELHRLNCPDPESDARRAAEARDREAALRMEAQRRASQAEAEAHELRKERDAQRAQTKLKPSALSLDWLHPTVRDVVVLVRASEKENERLGYEAREAAKRGQAAAKKARETISAESDKQAPKGRASTGKSNLTRRNTVLMVCERDAAEGKRMLYEGEVAVFIPKLGAADPLCAQAPDLPKTATDTVIEVSNIIANGGKQRIGRVGYGTTTLQAGLKRERTHQGQYQDGEANGPGTIRFEPNSENPGSADRFEGNFVSSQGEAGITYFRDGSRVSVSGPDGELRRYSRQKLTNGSIEEFQLDLVYRKNGPGVRWLADGTPQEQGIYEDGKLVTRLSPP
jgi:hypothetical protein